MKIVAQLSALDIKVFKWVDRKQLNVLFLLTEDDAALKVAKQITFRGLLAYKP